MWKTLWIINKIKLYILDHGILTRLFHRNFEDFHSFLQKKVINLLYLHQNLELWINDVKYSLSSSKYPQRL